MALLDRVVELAVDGGLAPDAILRAGVRLALRERLAEQRALHGRDSASHAAASARWVAAMRAAPIALAPNRANAQHYEVPAAFFELVLGHRRKYSCAYYPRADASLDEAEDAMLSLTCARAQLADGQDVLELGCGWGSLSLWMARHYPRSRIVAVSNSSSQRAFIEARARERGLSNLQVVSADMNDFADHPVAGPARFDRIVSVEMFEHMRNWEALLRRCRTWLRDEGLAFIHVFAHRRYAYAYEDRGPSDWMTREFFAGGMMPSHELLDRLDIPFTVQARWRVDGHHYARTAEDWLARLDAQRREAREVLAAAMDADADAAIERWRLFFIACAELFAWNEGREWFVSHNLLRPREPER